MANKFQTRRGSKASLPTLEQAEFGFCTDTDELFIGTGTENIDISGDVKDDDSRLTDSRTPTVHDLSGALHNSTTLSNLNSKISDATLIDTNDSRLSNARTPTSHGNESHDSTFITSSSVTYETLNGNSDVGTGATQVAQGDHTHNTLYLGINAKATDSDKLDGYDSTYFSISTHNHSLDSLSNTTITNIASGEILKWNGSAWINNTLSEAGIAADDHDHSEYCSTGKAIAMAMIFG